MLQKLKDASLWKSGSFIDGEWVKGGKSFNVISKLVGFFGDDQL